MKDQIISILRIIGFILWPFFLLGLIACQMILSEGPFGQFIKEAQPYLALGFFVIICLFGSFRLAGT